MDQILSQKANAEVCAEEMPATAAVGVLTAAVPSEARPSRVVLEVLRVGARTIGTRLPLLGYLL